MSTRAFANPAVRLWELPGWTTPRAVIVWSLVAAGVGLLVLALGLLVDPSRAWFAYVDVWTFGTTVCVGALLLLMVGHAAKASWMIVTRRLTEAVVDALPLYFLLFIPLAFGLAQVYPWASHTASFDPGLQHAIERKRGYLNAPFFIARTVVYFAVFSVVGGLLRAWSKKNDHQPRIALVYRMRRLGAGALPLVGLALTWASFDWTMSLEPDWYSTIYGLYYFAGCFVGALALCSVMLQLSRVRRVPRTHVTEEHAHALGRLLFAMVVFWAYMAFSQLLIYWIGDIPHEVTFYIRRTTGSWSAVTCLLVFGHLVVPFFLLLGRRAKRRPDLLASVGAFMLVMHFVDVYWLVMPAHDTAGVRPHWLDLGAVLFIGGLSCAWIVHRYFTAAPIPLHAPELAEGLDYEAAQ
jgi:hypothetical protein